MEEDIKEIELIDLLKVVWKWKWLIILGTFVCMVLAGVVSLVMPKLHEVYMAIEPGIIGVDKGGGFLYVDSPDNIVEKIQGGLYNKRIQKALNMNPLEAGVKFKVKVKKGTKVIIINSEWEENKVELGKKALVQLLALTSKESEYIIEQKKGDYEKQVLMKENQIEGNKATLTIIRDREKDLLQAVKKVKDNTEKMVQERNNVLQHKGNVDDLSLILYSTTIQQNVAYFNELCNQFSDIRTQKETIYMEIEDLKIEKSRLKLEKGIIGNIRVVQDPEVSLRPIKPKKRLIIFLVGIVSFFFLVFIAFFVEYIRNARKATE